MLIEVHFITASMKKLILILLSCLVILPSSAGSFLVLTDIHFDPFIGCEQRGPCALIDALEKAEVSAWEGLLAKRGDEIKLSYREDTPYSLLKSSLDAIQAKAKQNHVQYLFVLGDFLAHDYPQKYQRFSSSKKHYAAFVKKTMTFLTRQLDKRFPSLPIYPVIGNNDSYHLDYEVHPRGAFLRDVTDMWVPLLRDEKQVSGYEQSSTRNGHYAVDVGEKHKLRLIGLNTVLFSVHIEGPQVKAAAKETLQWLEKELKAAKVKQQRVMITLHIPPGIDLYASLSQGTFSVREFWQGAYTEAFMDLLERNADSISGILAGHTHMDWFQVLSFDSGKQVVLSATPAISPLFHNNPAFKIYSFDDENFGLKDYVTYFMPINGKAMWQEEYRFNHTFQPKCKHCKLIEGMKRLSEKGYLSNKFKSFYNVSNQSDRYIFRKWSPEVWCRFEKVKAVNYKKCIRRGK